MFKNKSINNQQNIKVHTLTSFVFEGWRFIITFLYNIKKQDTYIQVSTMLGHIPLMPDDVDKKNQLEVLLGKTQMIGSCRMVVNERQMIFLLAQKALKKDDVYSPKIITAISSELVLEARPILNIYKRFLASV